MIDDENNAPKVKVKKNDVPFYFWLDEVTLKNAKDVADSIDMSLAAFVRQSIKRNIKLHQESET
jgi:hypothetical protein